MVTHEQSAGAWTVWRQALIRREEARRTAMSEEEFGPQETERFELDTADITGEDNPRSFELDPYDDRKGPVDYRDADPRFA